MVKKQDVKAVGVVVAGVMLAGLIMSQFADFGAVHKARSGFGF